MPDLKPWACPFCKSESALQGPYGGEWEAFCLNVDDCGAILSRTSPEAVIAAWNRRPEPSGWIPCEERMPNPEPRKKIFIWYKIPSPDQWRLVFIVPALANPSLWTHWRETFPPPPVQRESGNEGEEK